MIRSAFSSKAGIVPRHLRRSLSSGAGAEGGAAEEKIVAAVLFERLPVVIPKIDPVVYAFQEFSFRWRQQYRRKYPDDVLGKADARGKGDYHIDYVPAPRITEADKTNDTKSLQRALDQRLYLLLYGTTFESSRRPIWHFPEKIYQNEDTLRLCAESALKSVLGSLHNTYFVGNAPMALMERPSLKRFFFKSQVIGASKLHIENCEDYAWVTKEELLEHFPQKADFFDRMIIKIK